MRIRSVGSRAHRIAEETLMMAVRWWNPVRATLVAIGLVGLCAAGPGRAVDLAGAKSYRWLAGWRIDSIEYDSDFRVLRFEPQLGSYLLTGWSDSRPAGGITNTYVVKYDPLHFATGIDQNQASWRLDDELGLRLSPPPTIAPDGTIYHTFFVQNKMPVAIPLLGMDENYVCGRVTIAIDPVNPSPKGLRPREREILRAAKQERFIPIHHPRHPYCINVGEDGTITVVRDDQEARFVEIGDVEGGDVDFAYLGADGRRLVVTSDSRRVFVYDCAPDSTSTAAGGASPTLAKLAKYNRPDDSVKAFALHPDGRHAFSGGKDRLITAWDLESGETLFTVPTTGDVRCLSVSPDGGIVAAGDDEKILVLVTADSGRRLYRQQLGRNAHTLEFHPLGLALVAACENGLEPTAEFVYRYELLEIPETAAIISAWHEEALTAGTATGAALSLTAIRRIEQACADRSDSLDAQLAARLAKETTAGPKDEFESRAEYDERVKKLAAAEAELRREYESRKTAVVREAQSEIHRHLDRVFSFPDVTVDLGQYNAETDEFSAKIHATFLGQTETRDIRFGLDRQDARSLKTNWPSVTFVGQARLHSDLAESPPRKPASNQRPTWKNRFDLVKLEMRDPTTKSFYAIDLDAPGPVYAVATSSPGMPPDLVATAYFEEPSGNDILDPEEEGTVRIEVENRGTGSAFDTSVSIEPRSMPDLRYTPYHFGEVLPGEKVQAAISLWAGLDLQDGTRTLEFTVRAAEGFAAAPVRLTFPTAKHRPPKLEVVDVGVEDWSNNGRIEPGEQATVTACIQNLGEGRARDVEVTVVLGEHVAFAAGASGVFKLGHLDAGEFKNVSFKIYTATEAVSLPITIDLGEGTAQYGTSGIPLDLAFDVPLRAAREVVVAGKADEARRSIVREQGLSVDVDENIPRTGASNPDAVAVVIGVFEQKYSDVVPQVAYAKRDAYTVRDYLIHTLGYAPENILPQDPDELMSAGAMKALMKDQLPATIKKDRSSDVFVYYSSHGAPSTSTQEAFLVPWDCDPNRLSEHNSYSVKEFQADLARLEARSVTLVMDACFSGQIRSGTSIFRNISPVMIEVENPFAAQEGMVVFASSAPTQVSNWWPAKRHGMFTYVFLKGLQGAGDLDADGRLTVQELETFLCDENEGVPYWSLREYQRLQVPVVVGDRSFVLATYK